MADCVSLSNAAELVEQLRSNPNNVWMVQAADTIEQLMRANAKLTAMYIEKDETACRLFEENVKLKAEQNAAVEDLKYYGYCKNCSQCTTKYGFYLCKIHGTVYWNDTCDDWEWRGVQKEEQ